MYKLKTNAMSYYKDQLKRINTKQEYAPTFKINSVEGDTKWMNLNTESAQALREWLDENYPAPTIKLEEVQDKKSY